MIWPTISCDLHRKLRLVYYPVIQPNSTYYLAGYRTAEKVPGCIGYRIVAEYPAQLYIYFDPFTIYYMLLHSRWDNASQKHSKHYKQLK